MCSVGERELVVHLAAIFLYTRRMHGIVGERERSNCDKMYITRPEKQAGYRRYMHMEYEVRSMKYKACSRDMHME